jgi:MarR family transcriptional regulator, transcriptional regulator for hemolysin
MTERGKKSIGFYIGYLARSAHKYFDHEFFKHGLNRGTIYILKQLYIKEGIKQNELCGNLHLDKAAVTRTLEKLESIGFVTRRAHPKDKRAKAIFLTPKARDFEKTFSEIFKNWTKILTLGFSETEYENLTQFMNRMSDNIEDYFQKEKLNAARSRT